MPPVVQKILDEIGFVEWDGKIHNEEQWNLYWKNNR